MMYLVGILGIALGSYTIIGSIKGLKKIKKLEKHI